MDISMFFKSVIEQDTAAVVICDIAHTIVYMNPAACERYKKRGGAALVGSSLLGCHSEASNARICQVAEWFAADSSHNRVHTYYNEKDNKDVYMIALRDAQGVLIGYYEKHEYRDRDTTPFYVLAET